MGRVQLMNITPRALNATPPPTPPPHRNGFNEERVPVDMLRGLRAALTAHRERKKERQKKDRQKEGGG